MSEPTYNKHRARRAFVQRHVGLPRNVLEIGALNAPLFGNDTVVKYADRFGRDELLERYPHKVKNVPRVDYVLTSHKFADDIHETFHCIVANHVVEHVPDLINWFDQLAKVSEPDGWIVLAVPDKRYTFDIIRPLTTMADVVDCAHRELASPSVGQIFAHLYMYRKVNTQDIWDGKPVDVSQPRMQIDKAVRKALAMGEEYHSVHCHVFTCDSFRQLFDELFRANLIDWVVQAYEEPLPSSNEFLVALKRAR